MMPGAPERFPLRSFLYEGAISQPNQPDVSLKVVSMITTVSMFKLEFLVECTYCSDQVSLSDLFYINC